jgi:hypothetical protein
LRLLPNLLPIVCDVVIIIVIISSSALVACLACLPLLLAPPLLALLCCGCLRVLLGEASKLRKLLLATLLSLHTERARITEQSVEHSLRTRYDAELASCRANCDAAAQFAG